MSCEKVCASYVLLRRLWGSKHGIALTNPLFKTGTSGISKNQPKFDLHRNVYKNVDWKNVPDTFCCADCVDQNMVST